MTTSMTAAENYHLKWDSHLSYLNLSVATLFKNEKFADVVLLTSHPDGGSGIPAHRIILSSCSHFFASIFDTTPSMPNTVVYIVLPPELSRRAIQILIQYMYSGEATVSNDILSEVLRGGEILKIRGLYRGNTTTPNGNSPHTTAAQHHSTNGSRCLDAANCIRSDYEKQPELRGLGASVLPKESPVIVRSPKPAQHAPGTGPLNLATNTQSITVKKDIAIDPEESRISIVCCGSKQYSKGSQMNSETLLHKTFSTPADRHSYLDKDKSRRHSEDVNHPRDDGTRLVDQRDDDHQVQRVELRRTSLPEVTIIHQTENMKSSPDHSSVQDRVTDGNIPEALTFLTIKQEPEDWNAESENENGASLKVPILENIKTESECSGEEDHPVDKECEDEMVYSPLSCELCGEIFTVPKEWVRHIETHMDNKSSYIPKKKRKVTASSPEYIPSLKCDLCSTYYTTPADWVKHIQSEHTETELAICNNRFVVGKSKPTYERYYNPRLKYLDYLGKTCETCNKKFASYASMIIHSRTHTGEKPFICSPCNKGFNVKSNLLRHMRTFHNQFEGSATVSDDDKIPSEIKSRNNENPESDKS